MDWMTLITAMRARGWHVVEVNGWVDVETPGGSWGTFAFTEAGLPHAQRFYQQQCQMEEQDAFLPPPPLAQ